MKLVFALLLLMTGTLAFFYLCKKMGIDVNAVLIAVFGKQDSKQAQTAEQYQPLVKSYGVEYESFASLVWCCLCDVWRICGLEYPDSVTGIYCVRIADRVRCLNGQIIFLYEVPVMNTTAIRNGKIDTKKIDVQKIREILTERLPEYMSDGYSYTGSISVWPIDRNRVRIEVQGIHHSYTANVGEILI